jgi:hypothetical protein
MQADKMSDPQKKKRRFRRPRNVPSLAIFAQRAERSNRIRTAVVAAHHRKDDDEAA